MKPIYILSIIGFLFLQSELQAQKSLKKARELKSNYEYIDALAQYNDYVKVNTPSLETSREIADSYTKINNPEGAAEWYEKITATEGHSPADVLQYAHTLKSMAHYDEAVVQYKKYIELLPGEKEKVTPWIEACDLSQKWMKEKSHLVVKNAEEFNTEYADFGLMAIDDGYILTSDRRAAENNDIYSWTGRPFLKLFYFSENEGLSSGTPKSNILKNINNEYHNGPSVYDAQKNTLYFTRTTMVKQIIRPQNTDPTYFAKDAKKDELISRLEIYATTNNDGQWGEVQPFVYNNADAYSVGHPALSPDGKIMYFVSDMPGGYGGTDIYYCETQSDGSWSKPRNAGDIINTSGNEMFPYVSKDGKLYFSSNGLPGMGGLDLFKTSGSLNKWVKPENLKYPINSPKDDFSMLLTSGDNKGFLASNRDGGKGDDDIYTFELLPPQNMTIVTLTLEKGANDRIIPLGNVNIEYHNEGEYTNESFITDGKGFHSKPGGCAESYKITAYKDGYLADYKVLKTECKSYNDTMFVELLLDKIIIGKPIAIKNIFYNFDKWDIRDDAKPELDNLIKILLDNPKINVELGSHTDSRGKTKYNQTLSQKRAESAVAYIVANGVDKTRITAKGYGEEELINKCADGIKCSDEEHQMNRRTEFKITSISK